MCVSFPPLSFSCCNRRSIFANTAVDHRHPRGDLRGRVACCGDNTSLTYLPNCPAFLRLPSLFRPTPTRGDLKDSAYWEATVTCLPPGGSVSLGVSRRPPPDDESGELLAQTKLGDGDKTWGFCTSDGGAAASVRLITPPVY